jgi:hypothetical protein
MARAYTQVHLKLLWGAGRVCAFPGCEEPLIAVATDADDAKPIAEIAHIVASSDKGPRGDPGFPDEERDLPGNLVLLCPTCHKKVDKQPNSYTSADLRGWKTEAERTGVATSVQAVVDVTFAELDAVSKSLLATPATPLDSLTLPTRPQAKLRHNQLGPESAELYQQGQLRFLDVEAFVADQSAWDDQFGERLAAGFRAQYAAFRTEGLAGDDLYVALAQWAAGGPAAGVRRIGAGLAILSYLFHVCDVFDREPST